MNELAVHNQQLPETLEDLRRFVLIGREKLTAVRAGIRAIDRLELAEDVRNQKKDEAQMLSEALLDAEVRLGELLKQIPKGSGGDRKSEYFKTDSAVRFEKPKREVIHNLGFSEKQAQRFEMLADNKDLVEQAKAEARENDDIVTRGRVLDLAQTRNRQAEADAQKDADYGAYIAYCTKLSKHFSKCVAETAMLDVDSKSLNAWAEHLKDNRQVLESELENVNDAIPKLLIIQRFLRELIK